jgi:hypothetical protein
VPNFVFAGRDKVKGRRGVSDSKEEMEDMMALTMLRVEWSVGSLILGLVSEALMMSKGLGEMGSYGVLVVFTKVSTL